MMKPRRARSKSKPDHRTSASPADHDRPTISRTEPDVPLNPHEAKSTEHSLPGEWAFLNQSAKWAAPQLLGQLLVRRTEAGPIGGIIVETEAYLFDDRQAIRMSAIGHATVPCWSARSCVCLFDLRHSLLRERGVRTRWSRRSCADRAIEPTIGIDLIAQRRGRAPRKEWTNGPGKVCTALGIDRALDGTPLIGDPKIPGPQTISRDSAHGVVEAPQSELFLVENPERAQLLEQFGGIAIGTRIGITKPPINHCDLAQPTSRCFVATPKTANLVTPHQ